MADSSHSIVIAVDASAARGELQALTTGTKALAAEIQRLGATGGFQQLQSQISALSAGFDRLKLSIGAINGASINVSSASRGFNELKQSAGSAHEGLKIFAAFMATMAFEHFAGDILKVGNEFLSLRYALDSVATSSSEAGDQVKWLFDLADRTGTAVEDAANNFRNLSAAMRGSGRDVEEVRKVFEAFQTGAAVLHLSAADTKTLLRELAETYSMSAVHATQAARSMATHFPGFMELIKEASGKTGEEVHAQFKKGGFDPTTLWPDVADKVLERYGSQLPEALKHSQASLNQLENAFTKLKLAAFEGGFDSGLTTLAKNITAALSQAGVEDIGKKIGEGFRLASVGATLLLEGVIKLREPLAAFVGTIAGVTALRLAFAGVAAVLGFLVSPLGILAGTAAFAAANWSDLKRELDEASPSFAAALDWITKTLGGVFDLNNALAGLVGTWEIVKNLFQGQGWDASIAAGAKAAHSIGEQAQRDGKSYADKFGEGVSAIVGKLKGYLHESLGDVSREFERLNKESQPHEFKGAGRYEENAKRYATKDNALSQELAKEYEKLNPTITALKDYKETLESIESMSGKSYLGHIISDDDVKRMKEIAHDDALKEFAPQVAEIKKLMDGVRIESQARANVGDDKDALAQEKQFLEIKTQLLEKHVNLTKDEEAAVRALIAAQASFNAKVQDGFTQFAKSAKDWRESLADNIKSGLDSIADGIAKIVTDGKGKFKNLGQAIRDELRSVFKGIAKNFLDQGIKQLMAGAIKQLNLSSIFGGGADGSIAKALGLGQSAIDSQSKQLSDALSSAMKNQTTAEMSVSASEVNVNGATAGGLPLTPGAAGAPATDSSAVTGAAANDNSITSQSSPVALPSSTLISLGRQLLGASPAAAAIAPAAAAIRTGYFTQGAGALKVLQGGDSPALPWALNMSSLASREQYAWSFFKSKGYSDSDTAKIMGNLKQESGFGPNKVNPNDGGPGIDSVGIAQWNRGRLTGMKDFASSQYGGKPYDQLTDVEKYKAQLGYVDKELQGKYHNALSKPDADSFGKQYEGFKLDHEPWRNTYANQYMNRFGGQQAPDAKNMAQDFQKQMDGATKRVSQDFGQNLSSASKTGTQALSGDLTQTFDKTLKSGATIGTDFTKLGDNISKVGQDATSTSSDLGTLASSIGKLASGAGGSLGTLAGGGAGLVGAFREGGYSDSPVSLASFWQGVPHFSEGGVTGNGGIPAVLHENEAVVPLTRGREIPVKMAGQEQGGDVHNHYNMTTNIQAANQDSFRRNAGQVAAQMQQMLGRLSARNN